jgi:hypothetical protein
LKRKEKILKAVFTKIDAHFTDLDLHLKEITPYTRLIHSELLPVEILELLLKVN